MGWRQRLQVAVGVLGLVVLAAPTLALELRVGALVGPRQQAALALAARVEARVPLQVVPVAGDAAALTDLTGLALVRATDARAAYEGTGRYDPPHKHLRTLAVLGSEVVHAWARPDRTTWAHLRGRPVALGPDAEDTLRALLGHVGVGLPDMAVTAAPDPLAAAQAGKIDAWLEVGLPTSATATALAALGWRPVTLDAKSRQSLQDSGWPLQIVPAGPYGWPGVAPTAEVVQVPSVLLAAASVPRSVAEDVVDALLPAGDQAPANVPLLQDARRRTAAKPVPTPLHPGAAASYARLGPLDGPIEVQVTVWVLDVSAIDIAAGTYDADLTLELRWQDARLEVTETQPFEIMNATETRIDPYGYASHGAWHALNWRVHAKLRGHFDLRRYPFDQQRLTIELEHPLKTADELVYRCETRFGSPHVDLRKDRLGPDLHLPDWRLRRVHTEEVTSKYGQDENFSRYRFVLTIERALLPFLVRELGPILLMVLLAWAAAWIPAEKIDGKLLLTVLALLVAVELQVAHDESAPHVGYPTLTEYLYLFAYLSISITVVQSIFEYRLHSDGRDPASLKVKKVGSALAIAAFVVPAVLAVAARMA